MSASHYCINYDECIMHSKKKDQSAPYCLLFGWPLSQRKFSAATKRLLDITLFVAVQQNRNELN